MSILFQKIWGFSVRFLKIFKIDTKFFFFEYTNITKPINCTGIEYFIGGGDLFLKITKRIFECNFLPLKLYLMQTAVLAKAYQAFVLYYLAGRQLCITSQR